MGGAAPELPDAAPDITGRQSERMWKIYGDVWEQEGRREGHHECRREGRKEGRLEGRKEGARVGLRRHWK